MSDDDTKTNGQDSGSSAVAEPKVKPPKPVRGYQDSLRDVSAWWEKLPEPQQGQFISIANALTAKRLNGTANSTQVLESVIKTAAIESLKFEPLGKVPDTMTENVMRILLKQRMEQWLSSQSDFFDGEEVAMKACGINPLDQAGNKGDAEYNALKKLMVDGGVDLLIARGPEASPDAEGFQTAFIDAMRKLTPDDLKKTMSAEVSASAYYRRQRT